MLPTRRSPRPRAKLLIKPLLFLLAVYLLSVVLYLLRHRPPDTPPGPCSPLRGGCGSPPPRAAALKPWPPLPSFLPWARAAAPAPRSCEAYFGNGFTRRVDVLGRREGGGGGGWFRCFHSETLASSICEGGNLRMDPGRIMMSRGGERLEEVMGRKEEEELPRFEEGAFQIEAAGAGGEEAGREFAGEGVLDRIFPRGAIQQHTMRDLIGSVRIADTGKLQCPNWIDEPTLLVTRFEYANLFHTVTDWYSAYVSSRVTELDGRPRLIFVDGHCKAPLEDTWGALFSSIQYAKNFSGPVCFRHAILSPLGYETAMFKGLSESFSCRGAPAHLLRDKPNDEKTARLSEFGEMLRAAFGLPVDDGLVPKPVSGHNVLFIRREDYLAHPRHDGKLQSRLSNEQEVFYTVKKWVAGQRSCNINLINGLFAHMPMKDQIRAIQEASVIIGAHGAGLTHLVAAKSNTMVLELVSSLYRRPHFQLISVWKGLDYHAIYLPGSHADPSEVVGKLSNMMSRLGC